MKGGLCIIYTSLLAISLLTSCALFVVSEALQPDNAGGQTVDASGLQNVSKKGTTSIIPTEDTSNDEIYDAVAKSIGEEMTFAESLSLNSVTTDGLPEAGPPPLLLSLADGAKLLRGVEEAPANDSDRNETTTFAVEGAGGAGGAAGGAAGGEAEPPRGVETLVVKARPMHEARAEEPPAAAAEPPSPPAPAAEPPDEPPPPAPQEDIPSFSEWAQRQLAAAARQDSVPEHAAPPGPGAANVSGRPGKVRSKNYASPACGAKVVAANPEAGSPAAVLSPNRDEYMLNACSSRVWFVVELCEPVQAQRVELANFELFSSTPRDVAVSCSDRYPTREWAPVGAFAAADARDVQGFDLHPQLFGKFVRVEVTSHHGAEHYCPLSLFKLYGTSEIEVLEKEGAPADDEDEEPAPAPPAAAAARNLFGSARDAVMSIVKKAARALAPTEPPRNASAAAAAAAAARCRSPSHIVVCDNCSESLYAAVYELLSCSAAADELLRRPFVRDALRGAGLCRRYGLDFRGEPAALAAERAAYVEALLPPRYLAALCNILAIEEKKVVLNSSFETESNVTADVTAEAPAVPDGEAGAEQEATPPAPAADERPADEALAPTDEAETGAPEEPKDERPEDRVEVSSVVTEEETPPAEGSVASDKVDATKQEDVKEAKEAGAGDGEPEAVGEGDSFLSELEQLTADPAPAAQQNQPPLPKESVFLRLSNRVKTLERNMSLSGQYLEELSRRYKKQVEEMQRTFEKAVLQMSEERRRGAERETRLVDQLAALSDRLVSLSHSVETLTADRDSWFGNVTFFKFVVLQATTVAAVLYWRTRRRPQPAPPPIPRKVKKKERLRRKSVEGVSGHATPAAKKRRPSEEALQIARACEQDDAGGWQVARRNRRRKPSTVTRPQAVWARRDSVGQLEDPIHLDEEEFVAPVSEPREFDDLVRDFPKANGSILGSFKAKTAKARRLSSPSFLRSFSRARPPAPPAAPPAPPSPGGSLASHRSDLALSNGLDEARRKKKGLKNIFKKVF